MRNVDDQDQGPAEGEERPDDAPPRGSLTDQITPPSGRHCQKSRSSAALDSSTYVDRSIAGGTMRVQRSLNHRRAMTLCCIDAATA